MKRPIEKAPDERLFFNVKKLDYMLNKLADEAFRRIGSAPTYGFILSTLKEEDDISQKDIAQMLYSVPSAAARSVEKPEYKGYVRTISEGRLSLVYLIEQGCQFTKEVDGSWEEPHQSYKAVLGNEASRELAEIMNEVTDELQKK